MRLVLEEKFNKHIKKEFEFSFDISENGLYIIEISGLAKSWLQNTLKFFSFFKDDDLAVIIDGREFPKLSGKKGLFDGEAAWNGNKLRNFQQVNAFFVYLNAGKHTLRFVADQSPYLETVKIYQTTGEKNIIFEPFKHYQIVSGNRRPWLKLVLVDLALEGLKIQASADQKHGDDDDLQIRINGKRQINSTAGAHKYWYWCGRVLKGQSKVFEKKLNLSAGLHYIELLADNVPVLDFVLLQLNILPLERFKKGKISLYRDIVSISKIAQLRSEATHTKDNIIKSLEDGTELDILEERVTGTLVSPLSNIWHKVRVDNQEGFVLSALVEIAGQEREFVVNKIRHKATELGADPDLMVALAGCESRYKPYAVSEDNAKGIMQLTDLAIQQVAKSNFLAQDLSDPFDLDQNIETGIRYFLWILDTFFKGATQALEKTVAAYNWKIERVSQLFGSGPLNIDKLPKETARHVLCVVKNAKNRSWKNIFWPKSIITVALLGLFVIAWLFKDANKLFANVAVIPTANSYSDIFPCPRLEAKDKSVELVDKNCQTARIFTPNDLRAKEFLGWSTSNSDHYLFALYHDIAGTMGAQQSQDGVIYFLLTTSGFCGSGGCSYVLYSYNTANELITVIETDVDGVVKMLLSPNGKKIAIASTASYDTCGANSYLRIIDPTSGDRKVVSGFEDQELRVTHILNLKWLSNDILTFSTSHSGDCDPITVRLKRDKENIFSDTTVKSRLIREYNGY